MRNRVKQLLDGRGKTRYWLMRAGRFTQKTAYRLYDDPEYIPGGEVLDTLCRVLGVQPGDLLEYVPDQAMEGSRHE
jgi:DNA-binding Xre family transcriptional regulator